MANEIQTGIQIDVNSDLAGLEEAREGLEQLSETTQQTQEQLEQLGESAEEAQSGLENIAGAEAGNSLDELGENAENAEERVRQLLEEIMRIAEEAENAGRGLGNLSNETNRAGTGLGNLERNAEGSLRIFDNLKAKVAELGTAFAALYSAKNIAGFFGSATSQAADFENQMKRIQAVMGAYGSKGEAELAKIEAKAKELGASTRFTASEVAEGFEGLARAGLSASQQLSMMNSILAVAQGNSMSIAQATDIVVTSLSQMGLEANEAGRVADVLSKAAQSANQSVQDLGEGFKFVAPTAKGMGIEIEELSSWLSVLNQNGLKAGMAGTALRNLFTQFSNPASNFRAELQAIGITTNNFEEAIKQLSQSTADTGAVMRSVGAESEGALRILGSGGYEFFGKMQEALKGAAGAAEEAAKTMDSSLSGAIAGLGSAWEGLKLELGKPMLDPLREQVNGLSQSIRDLTQGGGIKAFGESLASVFSIIAKSVGMLAKYSVQILTVGTAYASARAILATKVKLMAVYNAHLATATARTAALTAAKTKFRNALSMLASPMGKLTALFSAIGLAYVSLKSNVKEVEKAQKEANQEFSKTTEQLKELSAYVEKAAEAQKEMSSALNLSESNAELGKAAQAMAEVKAKSAELTAEDKERIEALKLEMQTALDVSNSRIEGYKKQQEAAKERFVYDKKAYDQAYLGIQQEQQRQDKIKETVEALNNLEKAQQAANSAKQQEAEAIAKSEEGWKQLTVGIDESRKALLQMPENTQRAIDAMGNLLSSSKETAGSIIRGFRLAGQQIETTEGMDKLVKMADSARLAGQITEGQFKELEKTLREWQKSLPPAVNEATVALNALGLTAQQVQTGISKDAGEAIKLFSLAAKTFVEDADKMGTVYNAALAKMDSPQAVEALNNALSNAVNGNNEFVLATQRAAESQRNAKNSVDMQQQALSALGVSLTAANQGMSLNGLEMANNLRLGLTAIQENVVGAENLRIAFETMFNGALNAAQTTADFQQLQLVLNDAGFTAQMTSTQLEMLNAGVNGGAEAVQQYKNSMDELKYSTDAQTAALDALGISIEAANEGMSKAGFEMASNFELAVQAMQNGITNADALGNSLNSAFEKALSAAQTTADFQALNETLMQTGVAAQMSSEAMQVLQAGMQGGAEAAKQMRAELAALAQAQLQVAQTQSSNAKISEEAAKKQAEAQKKIAREAKKTAQAIRTVKPPKLDNSGADKLAKDMQKAKKSIDEGAKSAERLKAQFKSLTDSARASADSIAQNLAQLRGEEEEVLEMQNQQKMRQLKEKLEEAKARGNQEEVKEYERAIKLQKELYAEQQDQLEKKKAQEEAQKNEQLAMSNKPSVQSPQSTATSQSSQSSINAEDVANAFSAQIEQAKAEAMQEGAKLGKEQLAKELIAAAKRRRR